MLPRAEAAEVSRYCAMLILMPFSPPLPLRAYERAMARYVMMLLIWRAASVMLHATRYADAMRCAGVMPLPLRHADDATLADIERCLRHYAYATPAYMSARY